MNFEQSKNNVEEEAREDLKFFIVTSVLIDWERRRSIHLDAYIDQKIRNVIEYWNDGEIN